MKKFLNYNNKLIYWNNRKENWKKLVYNIKINLQQY